MLLVTQDAERQFAGEIRNCVEQQMNARCIILRLSGVRQKPDDWAARTAEAIQHCLGNEGRIFIHESTDVAILVKNAARKEFTQLTSVLSDRLGHTSLQGLAFLYELPIDAATVVNLFPRAEKERVDPPESIVRPAETKVDLVSPDLVRTIGLRRKKRMVPDILVIEDDPFLQRLVSGLFIKDFRVTSAKSGADGLDLYVQQAPDIVFLDIGLPDMNGHDILVRILELDSEAYVVMLTGQGSRDNVLRAVDAGAKGFVGKPFTPDKLLSNIQRCPFIKEKQNAARQKR